MTQPQREHRSGSSFGNILTIMLGVLIVATVALSLLFAFQPQLMPAEIARYFQSDEPTAVPVVLPTLAPAANVPTNAPDAEEPAVVAAIIATFTPDIRFTETPAPLNTLRPTLTPSITPILPSRTATNTPTITPSSTATEGPPPTATNTRSPFPFTKTADSPFYLRKFTSNACAFLAGEVLDVNGNQAAPDSYRIHLWDADGRSNGIDTRLSVGNAPSYGQSGWELFISNIPEQRVFNVQLESNNGTAVSTAYQMQTSTDCTQNVVYLIFVQNR